MNVPDDDDGTMVGEHPDFDCVLYDANIENVYSQLIESAAAFNLATVDDLIVVPKNIVDDVEDADVNHMATTIATGQPNFVTVVQNNNGNNVITIVPEEFLFKNVLEEPPMPVPIEGRNEPEPEQGGDSEFAEEIIVKCFKCKECHDQFDSIEMVKNHYQTAHFTCKDLSEPHPPDVIEEKEELPKTKTKPKACRAKKRAKKARKVTEVKRKYPCGWANCDYVARCSIHLKDHRRIHTGEKPYRCTWNGCDLSFIQASSLKSHMRTHTGERPHRCEWPECQMRFAQKSNLKAHMRTHTGERPYSCDWPGCDVRFAVKVNLEHHLKTHIGLKQYACTYPNCSRTFVEMSHMRRHKRIHEGKKPYQCDWPGCNYQSVRRVDVANHKLIHTGERRYACTDCEKKFTRQHHWKKHRNQAHGG